MRDILHDIQQYNSQLTISQVVTFFERKGVTVSKSMIQNHVRDRLLPPPVNKRHYTHKHLAALAVISVLKTVYEMADIKTALMPLIDNEGISLTAYQSIINKTIAYEVILLMVQSADLKNEALRRLHNDSASSVSDVKQVGTPHGKG